MSQPVAVGVLFRIQNCDKIKVSGEDKMFGMVSNMFWLVMVRVGLPLCDNVRMNSNVGSPTRERCVQCCCIKLE